MTEKTYKPKRMTREQIRKGLDSVPMDTLILGVNSGASLTPKQREFARMVALGESKAQSYRKAYNSKGTSKTVANDAYKLSRKPDIAAMTEAFAQAKRFTESHTPEQMRAFVIQQLTLHAQNEDFPPAQRLKALELIGKHSGVDSFVNRSEVVHIKQSGDIRERIMDKLKLIGASTTIEANTEQDDAQDANSLIEELNQTRTIEPGEANDDEPSLVYQPDTELNSGSGNDAGDDMGIMSHNTTEHSGDTGNEFVQPIDWTETEEVIENAGKYQVTNDLVLDKAGCTAETINKAEPIAQDYGTNPTGDENRQGVTHRTWAPAILGVDV